MNFKRDAIERLISTALILGIPLITIESLHLPTALIAPAALILQVLKLMIAKQVGDPNSASLLPDKVSL